MLNRKNRDNLINISISLGMALFVGMILIAAIGVNPLTAMVSLGKGAFGSFPKLLETFLQAAPLIFVGLAVAVGFTGGVFNIGVEGQFLVGAFFAGLFGYLFPGLPALFYIPLLIFLSILGGALTTLLPAWLKVIRGSHEIISTIMMNYIALYVVHYLVSGPFKFPGDIPAMNYLSENAVISRIFPSTAFRLSYSFFIALLVVALVFVIINYSVFGYKIRAVGMNKTASSYSGINVNKVMILTFVFSGALAGLGGGLEVMGTHGRYYDGFAAGYGYAGIPVALLARKHPLGVLFAAIFFGALRSGSLEMQIFAGVPKQIVTLLQGLVIVFIAGEQGVMYMRRFLDKKRAEKKS